MQYQIPQITVLPRKTDYGLLWLHLFRGINNNNNNLIIEYKTINFVNQSCFYDGDDDDDDGDDDDDDDNDVDGDDVVDCCSCPV